MNNQDDVIYECWNCIYRQKGKVTEDSDGRRSKYDIDTYQDDSCSNIEIKEESYPSSNYFNILDQYKEKEEVI